MLGVLERNDLRPDLIVGSSAGSLVGARTIESNSGLGNSCTKHVLQPAFSPQIVAPVIRTARDPVAKSHVAYLSRVARRSWHVSCYCISSAAASRFSITDAA